MPGFQEITDIAAAMFVFEMAMEDAKADGIDAEACYHDILQGVEWQFSPAVQAEVRRRLG